VITERATVDEKRESSESLVETNGRPSEKEGGEGRKRPEKGGRAEDRGTLEESTRTKVLFIRIEDVWSKSTSVPGTSGGQGGHHKLG